MEVRLSVSVDSVSTSSVRLYVDTGAYVTVLSRETARRIGLSIGSGKTVRFQGFVGEQGFVTGELVNIPRVMLGKHFVHDVKVVVPSSNIAIAEVLGENILEYFVYVVDHDKDVIYFKKNPNPKPYINSEKGIDLSCGKVLLASGTEG